MSSIFQAVVIALMTTLALSANPSHAPRYDLWILPVPDGCGSQAYLGHGLSGTGTTIGNLLCEEPPFGRAIVWTEDGAFALEAVGGPTSYALGISHDGSTIVGMADTAEIGPDGYHVTRPVVWEDTVPFDIGTLGGPLGAAIAVNQGGTVVGACQSGAVDPRLGREAVRACLWTKTIVADLGDLGGPEAQAFDVNASGVVVGSSNTAEQAPFGNGYAYVAFIHDGSGMRSLGTLGGTWSEAWAINEKGDVVGTSATDIVGRGGRQEQHGFVWNGKELRDLGTLAGGFSQAWGINDQGDIVGSSWTIDALGRVRNVATLWTGEAIWNLNELVADSQGWTLERATAIDNKGHILVQAQRPGHFRVAVLLPRPVDGRMR